MAGMTALVSWWLRRPPLERRIGIDPCFPCGDFTRSSQTETRGVTVSMSAFLACHQCYCAGSSLAWGLNLRAVVCGIF